MRIQFMDPDEARAERERWLRDNQHTLPLDFLIPGHNKVKHVQYAELKDRMRSFYFWPPGLKQSAEDMARAGFFHTERGDEVVCYACGVIATKWLPEDEPLIEHIKFNNNCGFISGTQSKKFIKEVLERADIKNHVLEPETKPSQDPQERIDTEITVTEDRRKCIICFEREADFLFWPCKHLATCQLCGIRLTDCLICRHKIVRSCKIFYS